jgi:hypothetical protein
MNGEDNQDGANKISYKAIVATTYNIFALFNGKSDKANFITWKIIRCSQDFPCQSYHQSSYNMRLQIKMTIQ